MMSNLKINNPFPSYNVSKSDIFTLALSVLECILLQPLEDIYDFKDF